MRLKIHSPGTFTSAFLDPPLLPAGVELGSGERLEADLVIVASGRYSRLMQAATLGPPRVPTALPMGGTHDRNICPSRPVLASRVQTEQFGA